MSRFTGPAGPPQSLFPARGIKRKRQLSHLPGDSINPLSHSPAVLKQFRVAGFPSTEPPPSDTAPEFPHRPWRDEESTTSLGNAGTPSLRTTTTPQTTGGGRHKLLSSLRECVQLCLERGDVHRARKAMAGLARAGGNTSLNGSDTCPWSLRAEFIMSGADQDPRETREPEDGNERVRSQSWDPVDTMPGLRDYLSSLITEQTKGISQSTSPPPLDVWWALLSAELYGASLEHSASRHLKREGGNALGGEGDSDPASVSDSSEHSGSHAGSRNSLKDGRRSDDVKPVQGREAALKSAETAVQHLGRLVHSKPYKTDQDILHLYAAALLYLADLTTPPRHGLHAGASSVRSASDDLRNQAARVLRGILRSGGQIDPRLQRILDGAHGG